MRGEGRRDGRGWVGRWKEKRKKEDGDEKRKKEDGDSG